MNLILFLQPSVLVFLGLLSLLPCQNYLFPIAPHCFLAHITKNVFWLRNWREEEAQELFQASPLQKFYPIKVLCSYGLQVEILLHDRSEWSFHMHEYITKMYA